MLNHCMFHYVIAVTVIMMPASFIAMLFRSALMPAFQISLGEEQAVQWMKISCTAMFITSAALISIWVN